MKKSVLFFEICLVLFTFSCNEEKTSNELKDTSPKEIVLIFNQKDYANDTLRYNGGGYSPSIDVIKYSAFGNFDSKILSVDNAEGVDTLNIPVEGKIQLEHRYHYYHTSIYEFVEGDTVVFNYKDGVPFPEVKNREIKENDLNFLTYYNLQNDKPVSREEFFLNNQRFRTEDEKLRYKETRESIEKRKIKNIDSLVTTDKISANSSNLLKEYLKFSSPHLFIKSGYTDYLNKDSLLGLSTYRDFLRNYSLFHFKIRSIQKSQHESILDYRSLFDSLNSNSHFYSSGTKDYLLYESMKNIANDFSVSDLQNYFKKFKSRVSDSLLVDALNKNYLIDFNELKNETQEVVFIDRKKRKINLDELLKQNLGKVIYIDFWASWCAPCREVMPNSRELRNKMKDQDVVFLFTSIDRGFDDWQKASEDEELYFYEHSYLAMNYPNAKFYKDLKLKSIPRYLIYDKEGNIVDQNAPAPNADNLDELLLSYIQK